MLKSRVVGGIRARGFLAAAALAALATPIVFGLAVATPTRAQSQAQNAAAPPVVFEYEVASFKPNKGDGGNMRMGFATDALSMTNVPLQLMVFQAFGIQPYQLSGAPAWLGSDRYDVEAKIVPEVADALAKLTPEERTATRQRMLQALLADRLKFTFRREFKELPVYNLFVGKNGSKLKEAKPSDTNANGAPGSGGPGGGGRNAPATSFGGPPPPPGPGGSASNVTVTRGGGGSVMTFGGRGGTRTMSAQAAPLTTLVRQLGSILGRPVIDKTELKGTYDYKLEWAPDDNAVQAPSGGAPDALPAAAPSDPGGPTLLIAVQEQLGLKLESAKGPVEIIVIEHIEKPSDN